MPNTYTRSLLNRFPTQDVHDVLQYAIKIVRSLNGSISDDIAEGLVSRLSLRRLFLDATESTQHMGNILQARIPWEGAIHILPRISATHHLGRPVDDAFSTKLQRKLASTMPPRPIVQLKFDDAFSHLTRMLKDGFEVLLVLNYTDSQCLQVRRLTSPPAPNWRI